MAFDNNYPNRKDKRNLYRKSKAVDKTCRNHGSCHWCENGRLFSNKKREPLMEGATMDGQTLNLNG